MIRRVRRGKLTQFVDILRATMHEHKKTYILHRAHLTYPKFPFLNKAVKHGLIRTDSNEYFLTQKGKQFIQDYNILMEVLEDNI